MPLQNPQRGLPKRPWISTWLTATAMVASAAAQTAPAPQALPYFQNFGTTTFTTIPAGVAAWNGPNGGSVTSASLAASSTPGGDATISAATNSQTGGGCYGYATESNARFYIQTSSNSTNGANQLAIALNTSGWSSVQLAYDIEIVSAQPRTIGVLCQYRIGTSGTWASLTPALGNPFYQAGGSAGPKASVSILLPTAADNQPLVQIRWAVWRGSEAGNSSGLAIDNISATGGGDPWSPPPNHYAAAAGLTGTSLKSALQSIAATGHVPIDFDATFNPLRAIHQDPANSNNVLTVYSGTSLGKNAVYYPVDGPNPDFSWDREHLWPASYGLNISGSSYSDLFNLRPAIRSINNQRGNLYFDQSTGTTTVPPLAPLCSYDSNSWQPRDSEKGDIARAMFYMATRYDGSDSSTIDLELTNSPSTAAGRFAKFSTLLLWNEQDPVNDEEKRIHQLIASQQGNRNPFVDHPEFIALIWGNISLDKTTATVTEGGAGDSYTITLTSQPEADVTVQIAAAPAGQLTLSSSSVTFTPGNWNQPKTITLTATNDSVYESTTTVTLSHSIITSDSHYASLTLDALSVTVIDDDPLNPTASLPLAFGGPWSPLPSVGFLGSGVTTYGTSLGGDTGTGSAKFDDTNDHLTISFNSAPSVLSYHLKANTSGANVPSEGTFQILESADGDNFTLIRSVTNKDTSDQAYSDTLSPECRFVRFFYPNRSSGNIQLDKLAISALPEFTPWQAWRSFHSLAGASAEPAADPDFDGFPNLAEYALGRSPVAADAPESAHAFTKIPGKIRLTAVLRIADPDLVSSAQTTLDPTLPDSWTNSGVTRSVAADQSGVPSGFERTIFEIEDNDAPRAFARLRFSVR